MQAATLVMAATYTLSNLAADIVIASSTRACAMRELLRQPDFVAGATSAALVAVAVLLGPALAPYDPQAFHPQARLQAPSAAFLLGTDQFGRDLLSRLLTGARPTVLFGVGATAAGVAAGGLIGLAGGRRRPGRWTR